MVDEERIKETIERFGGDFNTASKDDLALVLELTTGLTADHCDEGSMINWYGGDCPVAAEQLVVVLSRSGIETAAKAWKLDWGHAGPGEAGHEIVRYRLDGPLIHLEDESVAVAVKAVKAVQSCPASMKAANHVVTLLREILWAYLTPINSETIDGHKDVLKLAEALKAGCFNQGGEG